MRIPIYKYFNASGTRMDSVKHGTKKVVKHFIGDGTKRSVIYMVKS